MPQDILEAHVQRVLHSPHFARADTQRRLLEYLWQHRNETLSEYALATEALGRNASFDSSVDASVRVHISRLRRKLKDYYQQEAEEPELLIIPTGTHQLRITDPIPGLSSPANQKLELAVASPNYRRWMWFFAGMTLAFAAATIALTTARLLQQRKVARIAPTTFWAAFLKGNAPIKILLPNPVFFEFPSQPSLRIRSTMVNDFQAAHNDPAFTELTEELGNPELAQDYTVTSDTLAAIDMARYLDTVGSDTRRVSFDVTRDSSMTVLEHANVIALGTHQTLQPLHQYLQSMNFSLTHDETEVKNAHPTPTEPSRYPVVWRSRENIVRPSVIAVLPGRGAGLKVLLLQSRDTAAMVSLLSSTAGSNSVEDMLHKIGNPQFYEMVVETELENNHAIRSWPVAVHAYRSGAPSKEM